MSLVFSISWGKRSHFLSSLRKLRTKYPSMESLALECGDQLKTSTLENWHSQGTRLVHLASAGLRFSMLVLSVRSLYYSLGTPLMLLIIAAVPGLRVDITNKGKSTSQDISSMAFKLRQPGGKSIKFSV